MAQDETGGDMDVMGRPWSARPTTSEWWREERGRERSQTNEKYCDGGVVELQVEVWVDPGRARL